MKTIYFIVLLFSSIIYCALCEESENTPIVLWHGMGKLFVYKLFRGYVLLGFATSISKTNNGVHRRDKEMEK